MDSSDFPSSIQNSSSMFTILQSLWLFQFVVGEMKKRNFPCKLCVLQIVTTSKMNAVNLVSSLLIQNCQKWLISTWPYVGQLSESLLLEQSCLEKQWKKQKFGLNIPSNTFFPISKCIHQKSLHNDIEIKKVCSKSKPFFEWLFLLVQNLRTLKNIQQNHFLR